jgi:hypothetical protein
MRRYYVTDIAHLTITTSRGETWSALLPPSLLATLLVQAEQHARALECTSPSVSSINPAAVAVIELQAAFQVDPDELAPGLAGT